MCRVNWSPAESQELQVASFLPTAETQGPPPLQRTGPDGDQIRVSAGEYHHWIDRHIVRSRRMAPEDLGLGVFMLNALMLA